MAGPVTAIVPDSRTVGVRHYYHVWADGSWATILDEHLKAVKDSGIQFDELVFGVVGSPRNVLDVAHALPAGSRWRSWRHGWEDRTMSLIHQDVQTGYDGYVMYAHTKGSAFPLPYTAAWRECMTKRVVRDGKGALRFLANGADCVGAHWLTPQVFPAQVRTPFYGGNFWWATTDHLRKLDRPSNTTRFHAEAWLGSVVPDTPVDLVPGWPGPTCLRH